MCVLVWLGGVPGAAAQVRWTAPPADGAAVLEVEARLVDGNIYVKTATAAADVVQRLLVPGGGVAADVARANVAASGIGFVPPPLSAELAGWLAVVDLFFSGAVRTQSMRKERAEDDGTHLRNTLKQAVRFSPTPGFDCVHAGTEASGSDRSSTSPSTRVEDLYGFEASEAVRDRVGLTHQTGELLWLIERPGERYTLKIVIETTVGASGASTWKLLCTSKQPPLTAELAALALTATHDGDGSIRATAARRAASTATAPERHAGATAPPAGGAVGATAAPAHAGVR